MIFKKNTILNIYFNTNSYKYFFEIGIYFEIRKIIIIFQIIVFITIIIIIINNNKQFYDIIYILKSHYYR